MESNLTQIEIGRRIAALRKVKKMSQEELAKRLSISRTTLTQMELGNRSINILELQKLAMVLEFTVDDFLSKEFKVGHDMDTLPQGKASKPTERISVPTLQVEKFKNVLLYILERCAGKPNVGETVLYKLLYFSDFNYYELYEEHLTGARYRKLPYGPVPQMLDAILNQMIDASAIQLVKTEYHGFPQKRYLPLTKPDLTQLRASEVEVIDRVIEQMSDWSAAMISDYSHGDKPWRATADKEELNYELAFYRRPPYSVRVYEEDERDQI